MLWRFYAYGLLSAITLDQFLWIIYLLSRGYTIAQVGVGFTAYQAVLLLTELPGSYLADRFGRKLFLGLEALCKAMSALFFLFANDGFMPAVLAGTGLMALAMTLPSGTNLAYFHEAIVDAGEQDRLRDRLSRFMSATTIGLTVGGLTAAVSILFTLGNVSAVIGTRPAGRIEEKSAQDKCLLAMPWMYVASAGLRAAPLHISLALGSVIVGVAGVWVAAFGLALGRFVSGMGQVILDGRILELAPDRIKATVLSTVDTTQAVLMAAIFPMLGIVSEGWGPPAVFMVIAAVYVAEGAALLGWGRWRHEEIDGGAASTASDS